MLKFTGLQHNADSLEVSRFSINLTPCSASVLGNYTKGVVYKGPFEPTKGSQMPRQDAEEMLGHLNTVLRHLITVR